MKYYGPNELAASMRTVRRHTLTIAEEVPEESYDYRYAPGSRSVREILLHMASMSYFDLHVHEGKLDSLEEFDFRGFFESLPTRETASFSKRDILDLLREQG